MTPDESRTLGNIEQKLSDLCESFDKFEKQAASNEGFGKLSKLFTNSFSFSKSLAAISTAISAYAMTCCQ